MDEENLPNQLLGLLLGGVILRSGAYILSVSSIGGIFAFVVAIIIIIASLKAG